MEISELRRDKGRVKTALKKMDDGSVIATEPLTVYFPKRFTEVGLADIGDHVNVIGILGFVTPDNVYFSMNCTAMFVVVPSSIRETNINGVRYFALEIDRGDTVLGNTEIIQDANLNGHVFDELYYYAKIPWYMSENQIRQALDRAKYVTDRAVANSPQVLRLLGSLGERDPDNHDRAYRYSEAISKNKRPFRVGLNNVSMLVDGTYNKLIGGYDKDTLLDALLNQDTKVTSNEIIMKGGEFNDW